ncbi:GntR family transcriptional regulator [Pseudonocardia lacus]|uniref:GntR family transcriptional regulator n=1 Tax=Pseudonocardia lacus TaxID=2835865 RepID=UPI001BDCFB1C|nr:GntR family transcriptional regulator [Pseudonocardia lacus]
MTTPKHAQLAAVLRARIAADDFPDGRLPSESELMKEHAMSRTTVRSALKELQNEGLLRSASGVGYFVRRFEHFSYRPQDDFRAVATIQDADSFTQAAAKRNPTQQIEVGIVRAPKDVARRLRIAEGDSVVVRRRYRSLDGVPYQINVSYYPLDIVSGTDVMVPQDIVRGANQLLADHGYAQVRALDEIWFRMPKPEEARWLDIGPGIPVAEHVITGFTADDQAVRMVRVILPGDRNVITFDRVHPDHERASRP